MKKIVIYNYSGYPGDLYQLVPIRYLASFLSYLNSQLPDSTVLWDRGTLATTATLSPKGLLAQLLALIGGPVVYQATNFKKINPVLGTLFKLLTRPAQHALQTAVNRFIEADAAAIIEEGFTHIFINLWYGPGVNESIYLARLLKEKNPHLRIFGIGQRVSWFRQYIVNLSSDIDAYILGTHSDKTLFRLVQEEEPWENISNLLFQKEGKIIDTGKSLDEDIDTKPLPDYAPERYCGIETKIPFFEIALSNEACPYACNFCVRPVNHGKTWTRRSIANIVNEIELMMRDHAMQYFRIADSTPPPGMLTELATEIVRRGLNEKGLQYAAFSRLSTPIAEDHTLLYRSGLRSVFFGLESGSQTLLDTVLGKNLKAADIDASLMAYKKAGMFTVVSLMVPAPHETAQTMQETLDVLTRLKDHIDSVLIQPAGVFPNTPWHTEPDRFGIKLHENYLKLAPGYPIDPLKPIKFWPPFPFSYALMEKNADEVTFADIIRCFNDFTARVHKPIEQGGLGLLNVQDYGYLIALQASGAPHTFSNSALIHMVTMNARALRALLFPRDSH